MYYIFTNNLKHDIEIKISSISQVYCTIESKINVTPKGARCSEKLQLTAALCNEI